ncbi:MAG: sn-glycerol-1-phosphate dehydrogenase [Christensenellaceae bacterium]|nr:sn-glycerol-1-phosphate dehydrogenase [Christensenellaceae bacterium]
MDEILNLHINEMAGAEFDCSCGRRHGFPIRHLHIGPGVLPELLGVLRPFLGKKLFIFGDGNTFRAAGERVVALLRGAGHDLDEFWFQTGENEALIPNESALGRLLMEMGQAELILGVGSGTINDLGKFISRQSGRPHIIVCTAPSMDGYVSDSSALTNAGRKISYPSALPFAVIADAEILKNAPQRLVQAGFGDVLGKLTALADWRLSKELTGEYYCESCVKLVQKALKAVTKNVDAIRERRDEGIDYLIQALVLTGVAMSLVGVSRPASGAEHMLSHHWEMDFQKRGLFADLHGIKVGAATPVVAELFELLKDELPKEALALAPTRAECERLLLAVGAPASPKDVHIDRELFQQSLHEAYTIRKRYSILQLAIEKGRMDEIAAAMTERIYGKA